MALDFGKLNFSTSFNPTSAFPLDARSYFESLEAANAAALTAQPAGSSTTVYYYGQTVAVVENNEANLYIIVPSGAGGVLRKLGEGSGGVTNFYVGYYMNGDFYKDTTYTEKLPKNNVAIYADLNGTGFYRYTGETTGYIKFNPVDLPDASEEVKGVMKLYQSSGQNTDGAMSQKAVTDGVKDIKFAVDESEPECLVLGLP